MSFGWLITRVGAVGMCAATACVVTEVVAQQQPAPRTVPIEFSDPFTNSALSNLKRISTEQPDRERLDILYQEKKPGSDGGGAAGAMVVTPPRPVVHSREARRMMDKDWVFNDAEESAFGLTPEQIWNLPKQKDDRATVEDMTALERFYGKGQEPRDSGSRQADYPGDQTSDYPSSRTDSSSTPFDSMPVAEQGNVVELFKDDFAAPSDLTSPWSLEGPKLWDQGQASTEVEPIHESYVEQYRQITDFRPAATADGNPGRIGSDTFDPVGVWSWNYSPFSTPSSRQVPTEEAIPSPAGKSQSPFGTPNDDLGTSLVSSGLPEIEKVPSSLPDLAPPSLTPSLPVEEGRPRSTIPPPVFEMPKPKF